MLFETIDVVLTLGFLLYAYLYERSNDVSKMYDTFRTDPEHERDGVWIDYGSFRVRLARAGGANKLYQRVLEHKTRPYRRALQTETIDNDTATRILREVFAETVVRGWQTRDESGELRDGIEAPDGNGELLPVTKENILATYERLPDLFDDNREMAGKLALYRAEIREVAAGNL